MLTGRQLLWRMHRHFQISDIETSVMDVTDLCRLQLHGDNLRGFNIAWDDTLLGMKQIPEDSYLENLYRAQVKKSTSFQPLFVQLENDHLIRGVPRCYHNMKKLVVAHLDEETRTKHLDAT